MWHLRDCAACCRLQDSSKTLETEQPGYFRALHANASSCCRQCQSRKQRKRQTGRCKGIRQRGKGKATHAARTCQKTFWKPSIGRNNNDRWQSTRGRWEQKIRGRERDSTHTFTPHATCAGQRFQLIIASSCWHVRQNFCSRLSTTSPTAPLPDLSRTIPRGGILIEERAEGKGRIIVGIKCRCNTKSRNKYETNK